MGARKAEVATVAVGLGGNLGERLEYLAKAVEAIAKLPRGRCLRLSSVYETSAVDCEAPLPFLNAVVCFEYHHSPEHLLNLLQNIERTLGRERSGRNAPRTIDLDILVFGTLKRNTPNLSIPHPALLQRLFALQPLVEVWEESAHPELGVTFKGLLYWKSAMKKNEETVVLSKTQWPQDLLNGVVNQPETLL